MIQKFIIFMAAELRALHGNLDRLSHRTLPHCNSEPYLTSPACAKGREAEKEKMKNLDKINP